MGAGQVEVVLVAATPYQDLAPLAEAVLHREAVLLAVMEDLAPLAIRIAVVLVTVADQGILPGGTVVTPPAMEDLHHHRHLHHITAITTMEMVITAMEMVMDQATITAMAAEAAFLEALAEIEVIPMEIEDFPVVDPVDEAD